jgi:type I restriction enzyme S subunit
MGSNKNLTENWNTVPLKYLINQERGISYGIVQPGSHDANGIPIIRVNNIRNGKVRKNDILRVAPEIESKHKRTRLIGGEVLLTLVGTLGETAIVTDDLIGWNVARAIAVIPPIMGVSAKWLQICLGSSLAKNEIYKNATTTVQATFNLRDVAELPIIIPPDEDRVFIEKIITAIDDKIELHHRMNATLEGIAQALFKSWFVDFDPVKAKADGRKPEGMDDATAALFPSRFTDSPLGLIPEGWTVGTLERVSFLNPESWSRDNTPAQIEYVDLANTKWGAIESTQIISWKDAPSRAQRILRKGDTIVGTVRPGNGSYSFISSDGLTGSTGFAVLRPREDFYREFVYLSTISAENIARLTNLADGAAYPAVRPDVVYATPISFPGDEILLRFSQCLFPIMEKIEIDKEENETLREIRNLLLPRLISGKLRGSDLSKEDATS